jgi:cytochrome c peroxidase
VRLLLTAVFVAGALAGGVSALALRVAVAETPAARSRTVVKTPTDELASLKAKFRRPDSVPFPADNPYAELKRALGERLFNDTRLSVDNSISCASCHDRRKGFADGVAHGKGVPGRPLARHAPTLWNLAYASHVFWDGRARSLEEQVAGPISSPDEMAQPVPQAVAKLEADPAMVSAFAAAFPADPKVTADNLAKAIATFERSLISPRTRFDRWIDGDTKALNAREAEGFRLFTGKAGCATCHMGFAFTDSAFHDIGLPDDDRGRGAVLRLPRVEHAFKTPGLRELGRSAPYMHDGSLTSLDAVLDHYQKGIVARDTLSSDLPRGLSLKARERAALIAFLGTLTSTDDPLPPADIVAREAGPTEPASRVTTVTQHDTKFSPTHLGLKPGERIWILNNDSRTHNVRVYDPPKLNFDSGAQDPGETVEIAFPQAGRYLVFCGIHPKMELYVDIAP